MSYHDDKTRVSNSSLTLFARAPILWKKWRDGLLIDRKTPDMIFGLLLHCLALEPQNLSNLFAVLPEDAPSKPTKAQLAAWQKFAHLEKPTKAQAEANEKTTKALEWWSAWSEANEGKELVDASDIAEAQSCMDGIKADPMSAAFLSAPGFSEVEIQWEDEATGLPCKAKLDRITRRAIIDLKTAADASAEGFKRAANDRRYRNQAAWYLDGVSSALKQGTLAPEIIQLLDSKAPELFVFIAVEKDENHLAHCLPATAEFIQRGRDENALLMRDLKHCINTDTWPGLAKDESGMTPMDLPSWLPKLETIDQPNT